MHKQFPGPDFMFRRLAPLFPILYEAYENAVEQVRDYFLTRKRPINANLFPCLVRDEFVLPTVTLSRSSIASS